VQTSLYHELAIVLTAAGIAAISWQAPNQTGMLTFVIFWLMRWSVKLNIFLGVRNLHHEFWPSHLQYLQSYTRNRVMNAWFPCAIAAALAAAFFLLSSAAGAEPGSAERTSAVLLLSILLLAILEHALLMLPVPDAILWRAGTRSRESAG
jgi:putative photosynthetic complex assembly protein 2